MELENARHSNGKQMRKFEETRKFADTASGSSVILSDTLPKNRKPGKFVKKDKSQSSIQSKASGGSSYVKQKRNWDGDGDAADVGALDYSNADTNA